MTDYEALYSILTCHLNYIEILIEKQILIITIDKAKSRALQNVEHFLFNLFILLYHKQNTAGKDTCEIQSNNI